ncbi:hypothetical protein [Streptomyces neyagawaensis]|uniref:hypothetical protein n=1 Tax=Streptomyces neyagawaensis TaxID=42238 RepID=UPI003EC0F4CF
MATHRLPLGSPLQLLLLAGSFALAGYAGVRLLADDWFGVALWFVGAAVVHDLVLLPLYAAADRALVRAADTAGPRAADTAGPREEAAGPRAGRRPRRPRYGGRESCTCGCPPPCPGCSCWCGSR